MLKIVIRNSNKNMNILASQCNDIPCSFVLVLPMGVIVVSTIRVEVGADTEAFVRAVNKF